MANATGLTISSGASDNTIGGNTSGALDVISGNAGNGVQIQQTTSSGNVVEGDYIGTDMTGNVALGNVNGILLFASGNTIGGTVGGAGNIIAGNDGTGYVFNGSQILIAGNPGFASDNNLIAGNYIGLDANGQALAGATNGGIVFDELTSGDTTGNTIGGTIATARNIISGNFGGIDLIGDNGNLVEGNYIGTDPTGTIAIGNGGNGDVNLTQGASDDTIGGTTAGARNIISGDYNVVLGGAGVEIASANNCVVEGNYIGTDLTGTKALPNKDGIDFGQATDSNDTIGGATATPGTGAGNVIAGNQEGISFFGTSGVSLIEGNAIGQVSLPGGGLSPGNFNDGINIINSASSALIGGSSSLDANVISGNANDGIEINVSSGILVAGDLIGTNLAGTSAVPNATGVELEGGSSGNTIGGLTTTPGTGAGNVISGNTSVGVEITGTGTSGNVVAGNIIGLNAAGSGALANDLGVDIGEPASGNTIGGAIASARNVISGNSYAGIQTDGGTSGTVVEGNFIGSDLTGTVAIGNTQFGIRSGGTADIIGGATDDGHGNPSPGAAPGNVVVGSQTDISLVGTATVIAGNLVGLNATGTATARLRKLRRGPQWRQHYAGWHEPERPQCHHRGI